MEQWTAYTERFEYFVLANGIGQDKQVATFLTVMGVKTFNLIRALAQPKKPGELTYQEIVTALTAHFSPKPLQIAERFRFYKRNQEEGESVTVFVAALRTLTEHCEFKNDALNDAIRDRLVCGLRNEAIQRKLLTESNLTLTRAIEISVSMEMAAKEAQLLSAATGKVLKIASTEENSGGKPCFRCGKLGHPASACWCKDLECHACGKKGHIERACHSKKTGTSMHKNTGRQKKAFMHKGTVHALEREISYSGSSDDELPLHILSVAGGSDGYWTTPLLEGIPVRMEIDTGAAVSLIAETVYLQHLQHRPLQPTRVTLKTYTGEPVAVKGLINVKVELNGQCAKLPLYVVQGDYPSLLGRSWLNKIQIDWPAVRMVSGGVTALQTVLKKHEELFTDELGKMKDITAKQVKKATQNDPGLSAVIDAIIKGKTIPNTPETKPYAVRQQELSVQSGCLLWGRRVIMPPALYRPLLKQLHAGHCGMVRMKELAPRSYRDGPKWVPAVVVAITGPLSYQVRTSEDLVWRRHIDQLLASSNPVTESIGQDTLSPECPSEDLPIPDIPPPAVSGNHGADLAPQAELSTEPVPLLVPMENHVRRYPNRERSPPDRLNLRKWNEPRREGPYKVTNATPTVIEVEGSSTWYHLNHCTKAARPRTREEHEKELGAGVPGTERPPQDQNQPGQEQQTHDDAEADEPAPDPLRALENSTDPGTNPEEE
ncbi:Gag polyprotein [Merluccius polli]|uniref:Gag polyprotein n=1 Tax=Merluccius polli TaxID=89951 RepID=A0AA47NZG2_MERPO|nr:Gag polyprotein [Merluccius polli]